MIEPVLDRLRTLSYDEACELREVDNRVVAAGAGEADLTVYREERQDGVIHLIVQLSVDHGRFLLLARHGQTFAEGLEFRPAAAPRRLLANELYYYT